MFTENEIAFLATSITIGIAILGGLFGIYLAWDYRRKRKGLPQRQYWIKPYVYEPKSNTISYKTELEEFIERLDDELAKYDSSCKTTK